MNTALKYSLLTVALALVLIPIHELIHLVAAVSEGLPVAGYSLLSLSPSVTLNVPGSIWFFISGPLVVLVIVGIGLWYSWKKPFRNYLIALLIAELAADLVDFTAVLRLIFG